MQKSHKGFWTLVIIIVLVIIGFAVYYSMSGSPSSPSSMASSTSTDMGATQNIEATFACDDGRSIDAMFMNATTATTTGNEVMLTLSDGRQMTLPQVISADGARYASADGSFVFWNVGDTATVTENGTTTYSNCMSQSNQ